MRMIHDNKQRELTQLLRNPLFSQLTDFLYENQNVTLRQLTQQFSEKGFIKFLESCIEAGLILREERRYRLGLPVFTGSDYQEVVTHTQKTLLEGFETYALADICQWYQQQFYQIPESFAAYFIANDVNLAQVNKVSNEKLAIWSVNMQGFNSRDLPGYFEANRQLLEPAAFSQLRRLVGDVDEEYFLGQVGWIISRVLRGKQPRASIFLTALCQTEVLSKDFNNTYQLKIPCLSENNLVWETENNKFSTSKSHFSAVSLYSEVCQRYCSGFLEWVLIK